MSSVVDALLHPWSGRIHLISSFPPLAPLNIHLEPRPVRKRSPSVSFENAHFKIARSRISGWGAFAVRPLRAGDVILCEFPLLVADCATLYERFARLTPGEKDVAYSLLARGGKLETSRIRKVWDTNCFTLGIRDLAGLFPIAARFNHACHPANNVSFKFDPSGGYLTMTARAAVPPGEELTISYGDGRSPLQLWEWYGFRCRCGACAGLDEDEMQRWMDAQW